MVAVAAAFAGLKGGPSEGEIREPGPNSTECPGQATLRRNATGGR